MIDCAWLPDLFPYDGAKEWKAHEGNLYEVFKRDFIVTRPKMLEKNVNIRKHPMENDKEEAFYHVTCQDYFHVNDRVPDMRRCERIRWVRKMIENHACTPNRCINCDGMKMWVEKKGSDMRWHILLEAERYMVVVAERADYCLLITAFYVDQDHRLQQILSRFEKAKRQRAPT